MERSTCGACRNLLWAFLWIIFSLLVLLNYSNKNVAQWSKKGCLTHHDCNRNTSSVYVSDISVNENGTTVVSIQQAAETESNLQNKHGILHFGDPCMGKYVYVHDIPRKFNLDILKDCEKLSVNRDMCPYLSNDGLGMQIEDTIGVFSEEGWFNTYQFILSVIFHRRLNQYKCLTDNSTMASAIYVPYYAGHDIGRYLYGYNISVRDSLSNDLIAWLTKRPEWQVMGGRDHFVTLALDFVRDPDHGSGWGSSFMVRPEGRNMSMLTVESTPWHSNGFAIPYPTYFHPSNSNQLLQWQKRMRIHKKHYLFSFAGAPRLKAVGSVRDLIIDQCVASKRCKMLDCGKVEKLCHTPSNVMKLFQHSLFCLQPEGDTYTRRSSFDSILAGCIPVFFHRESAYTQYKWHLPEEFTKYSVFIPANEIKNASLSIEGTLKKFPWKKVRTMRRNVINLIPKLVYADPGSRLEKLEDAFDISIERILQRVNEMKRN